MITIVAFKKAVVGTGGIMLSIATKLGCSRQAVYDFCNKYPEMMELRHHEEEKIIDIAENGLFTKAKEKDMWAVKYLLSTKGKKRGYVERQEVENSGQQITIQLIEKPVEEIKDGLNNKPKTD